jgi:hypothetical protein
MDYRQFRFVAIFMALVVGFMAAAALYWGKKPDSSGSFFGVWLVTSLIWFGGMVASGVVQ